MDMQVTSQLVRGLVILLLIDAGAILIPEGATGGPSASPRAEAASSIDLTMTPEEQYKIMYVEPNQTKTANLTVMNLADENDTVFLNLSVDFRGHPGGVGAGYNGTGWKVMLEAEAFELAGCRSRHMSVGVKGPKTGVPNDYIDVRVDASSMLDPAGGRNVSFRVYLCFTPKFALYCADKVHTASWGGTTYDIKVQNIGHIETGVILNVTGPTDWDYHLDVYCLTLEVNETALVTLTVIPPDFAPMDEVGVVTVTGRSALYPAVKDRVTTHTIACMCLWWELAAPDSEALVDPGEQHVFALQVSNSGNFAGAVNISLSLNQSSPDWTAALATDLVKVAGGETKTVNLTVKAPADAPAGSRLVTRVIGRCPKGFTDDCTFTAVVNLVHNVGVISSPQPIELLPGETAACDITVRNDGNGDEKLRPEIPETPQGLEVVLKWPNGTFVERNDWARIGPGDHFNWLAVFTAAPGCIAGECHFPAQIRFGNNSTQPFELGYRILRTYGLDLRVAEPRRACAPGHRVVFDVACDNWGNGPEEAALTMSGLPDGWPEPVFTVRDSDTGGVLRPGPFGQVPFVVEVAVPRTASRGTFELNLSARSPGAFAASVRLAVDVRMPDLVVSGLGYSTKFLKLNIETLISVKVSNFGDIAAENVTVRFFENDKAVGNERLERMPPGSEKTATFAWVPHHDRAELRFEADPDNEIIEYDEKNNNATENVRAYPPTEQCPSGPGLACLALFVLLLAPVAYLVWKWA